MEFKLDQVSETLSKMKAEQRRLHQEYIEERRKRKLTSQNGEKLHQRLESLRNELEMTVKRLDKQEAQHDLERKNLLLEKEKYFGWGLMSWTRTLHQVKTRQQSTCWALVRMRYNTTVRHLRDENTELHDKFVEEIRKVNSENIKLKCELRRRTKELEERKSQNDLERRSLLNEVKSLKENLPCQNLVEVDKTSTAQVAALRKELEETSKALQDLESRYNCLTVKQILTNQELLDAQNLTNQELQDARKESINGLKDMLNSRTTLVVKRMGEIDQKAFEFACSLKFPNEDWQEICAKLCSSWEQNVKDQNWHPFKRILFKGKLQVPAYTNCTV
ncbi:hypothetical protein CRYUN_Cryun09bG0098600 [Craigia yunnanensis]